MRSSANADRRVYAQDTEPVDTRDGILWVDTSVSPRETFVYSTDTESWEPTQQTEQELSNISVRFSGGYMPNYMS